MRQTYIVIECDPLGSAMIRDLLTKANINFTEVELPEGVTFKPVVYPAKATK